MGLTEKELDEAQKREKYIKQSVLKNEKPVKTAGQKIREIYEEDDSDIKKKYPYSKDNLENDFSENQDDDKKYSRAGDVGRWFQTLCIINIPVIGIIYIIIMALRRKTPYERKSFAIAYILYKLLVWILAISVIYCFYKVGINFIDGILQYASGS